MDEFIWLESKEELQIYCDYLKSVNITDNFGNCTYSKDGIFPLITHNVHGYYHADNWRDSKFNGVKTVLTFKQFEQQYLKTESMKKEPFYVDAKSFSLVKAFIEEITEKFGYKQFGEYALTADNFGLKTLIIRGDAKPHYNGVDRDIITRERKFYNLPQQWDDAMEACKQAAIPTEDIRKMPFGKHDVQVNLTKKTVTIDGEHMISTANIKRLIKFREINIDINGYPMEIIGTIKFGCKSGSTEQFADILELFK
jgi:hypothetical protein